MGEFHSVNSCILSKETLPLATVEGEVFRKLIHMLIVVVPVIAAFDFKLVVLLIGITISLYTLSEFLRLLGFKVPLVSKLTLLAARSGETNHFIVGPITLAAGVLITLFLYPLPIAAIAIYVLAFGDSAASLFGMSLGKIRLKNMQSKTFVGSGACFFIVLTLSLNVLNEIFASLLVATTASILEAIPVADLDNLIIPIVTGFVIFLFV